MTSLESTLQAVSDWVWGPPLLILLFGTHLFLTFRLRFIQKYLPQAIRLSLSRDKEGEGDVSQFGALATALAATIGTGNIVGVSTAIAVGGPGAVLWMWLTGVFGVATKYSEAVLAVKYRIVTKNGSMAGGPMYVLERGLKSKPLGMVCAMTGLVIVNSGEWRNGLSGAALTHKAFEDIPVIGSLILTVGLLTFVFSTILGWSYYGEKAAEYLFGSRIIRPYRVLWVIAVMVGSVQPLAVVWTFSDIANGLMAVPNLIALLGLSGVVVAETREYLWSGNLDKAGS